MKAVESIFIFIFLIYFGSCIESDLALENQPNVDTAYANVDPALVPHFRSFEQAAANFGFNVDLSTSGISGKIISINDGNIAGTCSYSSNFSHRDIEIDKSFWDRASHLYREYIIFHELGHCYLRRDHKEGCLQSGIYQSLMRSGEGGCRDNYSRTTRDYYIRELFSENIGA